MAKPFGREICDDSAGKGIAMSNMRCGISTFFMEPQPFGMILFRVDANPTIGFGHIMRCLSIADAAASLNQQVFFILADDTVRELVVNRGYPSIVLGRAYHDLEGEVEKVSFIIAEKKACALVVDSYFVTEWYLNALLDICRSVGCRLIYIDDVLAFPYPCDVLLNYNIYAPEADYKGLYQSAEEVPDFLLLGTLFTPLRREFQNLAPRVVRRQGRNIFISTGGSDFEHITLEFIEEIRKRTGGKFTFHIIIGAMNEDKELIYDKAKSCPNMVLHERVKNMSDLMQICDVAISAAGSTLYELCATQTPTITYILADNQVSGAESFEHRKVLQCAGDVRRLGTQRLVKRLLELADKLCDDYCERCRIVRQMSEVVDARGAERIAKAIIER